VNLVRAGGLLVAGAFLFFVTSCGSNRPRTYPTKGQVIVNGSPAAGVKVVFAATGDGAAVSHGITGPDGNFQLSTFGQNDGAPPGDYLVTLTWPAWDDPSKPAPDKLKGAYQNAGSTGLKAHVDAKETTLVPFEIKGAVISEGEVEEVKKLKKHQLRKMDRKG